MSDTCIMRGPGPTRTKVDQLNRCRSFQFEKALTLPSAATCLTSNDLSFHEAAFFPRARTEDPEIRGTGAALADRSGAVGSFVVVSTSGLQGDAIHSSLAPTFCPFDFRSNLSGYTGATGWWSCVVASGQNMNHPMAGGMGAVPSLL